MKKFTLLFTLLFVSVLAFAQQGHPASKQPVLKFTGAKHAVVAKMHKGLTPKALSRNLHKAPAVREDVLVTPPEGVEVLEYTLDGSFYAYYDDETGFGRVSDATPATAYVVIDGNDFYVQGLSYWFPEAWVKGTISGDKAVVPTGQYLGTDDYGAEYLVGQVGDDEEPADITFSYDAETGSFALAENVYILETAEPTSVEAFGFWMDITLTAGAYEAPDVVLPPDGLETQDWVMTASDLSDVEDEDGEDAAEAAVIRAYTVLAFDGDDVYIQGLNADFLPEAWVKGTRSDNTITVPTGQYLGAFEYYGKDYAMYLVGANEDGEASDIVLTYSEDGNVLTTEQYIIISDVADNAASGYARYKENVLTKVDIHPATPETPVVSTFEEDEEGYHYIIVSIPTVDTEGEEMGASLISYQIFTDVEGNIQPYAFTTENHPALAEEMEVVPFKFTDNYDILPGEMHVIYLYGDNIDDWNRVGVKSFYTVDGDANESEIGWFEIQPYGSSANKEVTTFDFNALPSTTPTSSQQSTAGDITENTDFTEGNVTLTVSESNASTANRLWSTNNGIQLRVYGGTLTFSVPEGYSMKKIVFNAGRWNSGNTATPGTLGDTTWKGDADKVVVSIAGNTQINSIEVTVVGGEENPVDGIASVARTASEGAIYTLSGVRVKQPTQKGVYIQNGKKVVVK